MARPIWTFLDSGVLGLRTVGFGECDVYSTKRRTPLAITIELPPELEADLAAQARERGFSLSTYIQLLIQTARPRLPEPKRLTREEFEASLDRMEKHSDKIPVLPIEAFFRESLYDDHD